MTEETKIKAICQGCGELVEPLSICKTCGSFAAVTVEVAEPPKPKRHKWGETVKNYGYARRRCQCCGIDKMMRHSGGHHWTEWWRDGKFVSEQMPQCF